MELTCLQGPKISHALQPEYPRRQRRAESSILPGAQKKPARMKTLIQEVAKVSSESQKPVRHLILCRFRADVSPEQIGVFMEHFRALTDKIPGILGFESGANHSPEGLNQGLTHACLLTFENAQARDAYLPHPEHRRFVAADTGILDGIVVFDYTPED